MTQLSICLWHVAPVLSHTHDTRSSSLYSWECNIKLHTWPPHQLLGNKYRNTIKTDLLPKLHFMHFFYCLGWRTCEIGRNKEPSFDTCLFWYLFHKICRKLKTKHKQYRASACSCTDTYTRTNTHAPHPSHHPQRNHWHNDGIILVLEA